MKENEVVNWTIDQINFQRWLALPRRERKPKTMDALALQFSVGAVTLYRWKQLPGFVDEVRKLSREFLSDDLPDIYAALRKEAKAGSFQHIKLALELADGYVEKSETVTRIALQKDVQQALDKVYGEDNS